MWIVELRCVNVHQMKNIIENKNMKSLVFCFFFFLICCKENYQLVVKDNVVGFSLRLSNFFSFQTSKSEAKKKQKCMRMGPIITLTMNYMCSMQTKLYWCTCDQIANGMFVTGPASRCHWQIHVSYSRIFGQCQTPTNQAQTQQSKLWFWLSKAHINEIVFEQLWKLSFSTQRDQEQETHMTKTGVY